LIRVCSSFNFGHDIKQPAAMAARRLAFRSALRCTLGQHPPLLIVTFKTWKLVLEFWNYRTRHQCQRKDKREREAIVCLGDFEGAIDDDDGRKGDEDGFGRRNNGEIRGAYGDNDAEREEGPHLVDAKPHGEKQTKLVITPTITKPARKPSRLKARTAKTLEGS
jgi:hypothetical protein